LKSLDKLRQQPNTYKRAGKTLIKFLPALFLPLLFTFNAIGQKLVINSYGFKIAAEDTVALGKLVRYEAFVYNGLFDRNIPDSLPVVINLYKSKSQFLKVRDSLNVSVTTTGFYHARTRQCYVYKGSDFQNVIVHEASHLFMHYHKYYAAPKWINEGLSEFFEGLYLDDRGRVYIDPQKGRLLQVRNYVNNNEVDLADYLNFQKDAGWTLKNEVDFKYNVAYAMVYYIIKTNPQFIKLILAALDQGNTSYDSLAKQYGSFEYFENRFKLYYRNFR